MRESNAKIKLKNGQPITIAYLYLRDPVCAEIMTMCGVDILLIDNEHMAFDDSSIQNIARAIQLRGGTCLLRTAVKDVMTLTRYMAMGVDGFCATQVSTVDHVKAVIEATKYPMLGGRGMCNISMGNQYGFAKDMTKGQCMEQADDNTIILAVVESEEGVSNVGEIARLEGVDMVDIGAVDLSSSLGLQGNSAAPEVQKLVMNARKEIAAAGKRIGIHVNSLEEIANIEHPEQKVIYIGSDLNIIQDNFIKRIEAVKSL